MCLNIGIEWNCRCIEIVLKHSISIRSTFNGYDQNYFFNNCKLQFKCTNKLQNAMCFNSKNFGISWRRENMPFMRKLISWKKKQFLKFLFAICVWQFISLKGIILAQPCAKQIALPTNIRLILWYLCVWLEHNIRIYLDIPSSIIRSLHTFWTMIKMINNFQGQ